MSAGPCHYASYCPRRARDGDRPDGCSSTDLRTCRPRVWRSEIVAPAPFPRMFFLKRVDAGQADTA